MNSEAVEQMYRRNPILRYTQHPLHSPLLPLPYGEVSESREYGPSAKSLTHRKSHKKLTIILGLHDILRAIVMRISSVKTVL